MKNEKLYDAISGIREEFIEEAENFRCEFPYKSRVMPTDEPLKNLKVPYTSRNPVKWGFFRLKELRNTLKILIPTKWQLEK